MNSINYALSEYFKLTFFCNCIPLQGNNSYLIVCPSHRSKTDNKIKLHFTRFRYRKTLQRWHKKNIEQTNRFINLFINLALVCSFDSV